MPTLFLELLNQADLSECLHVFEYEVGGNRPVLRGQLRVNLLGGARTVQSSAFRRRTLRRLPTRLDNSEGEASRSPHARLLMGEP